MSREDARPTHEQIAERAYALYLAGCCRDGNDLQDWLVAEKMLMVDEAVRQEAEQMLKPRVAKAAASAVTAAV